MLSHHAFDTIGAREYAGMGDLTVIEVEHNLVWILLDVCEAFAKSYALYRYKAGHDVEQCLSMGLLEVRSGMIDNGKSTETHRFAVEVRVAPRRMTIPLLILA